MRAAPASAPILTATGREGRPRVGLVLALLCLLQIAVLAAVVGRQLHTVATGQAIILQTAPVPPLPLYRGGHVPLRYGFSDIPIDRLPTNRPPRPGDRLWIVLSAQAADGSVAPWHLEAVLAAPPERRLGPGRLLLRGYVRAAPEHGGTIVCPPRGGACRVWLDYGLERFPVPDGQATRWEDWRKGERLEVVARVSPDGNAIVTGLLLGDHLVRRDPLDWLQGSEAPAEVPRPKGPAEAR